TLTQNRMTIVELRAGDGGWRRDGGEEPASELIDLIRCGILASAREPFDPMEMAFYALGKELEPNRDPHAGLTLRCEFGLRPELLAVTNIWERGPHFLAATKGAPEAIVELCCLDEQEHKGLAQSIDSLARRGVRVLGVAVAELPADLQLPNTPRGLP